MADSFSVAMCTYNGARFVAEQLASIAAQTRPPDELVVCDDGSTDATVSIVREFAASAPFPVRLHVNEQNLGTTKNFERAISLCEGDLIALCDQDDVWLPGKLARLEEEFRRRPRAALVFSDAEVADEFARPTGRRLWESIGIERAELKRLREGKGLGDLLPGATVTGATAALRARLRPLVLPIPEGLPVIHDAWIALLAACVAEVAPVEEPLVLYRCHPGQQVGALGRMIAAGGLREVRAALARRTQYAELIRVGECVRRRLLDRCGHFDCARSLDRLDERLTHLRMRGAMPAGRLARLPRVLRELLTFRYSRYSKGFYSAVKDILA